MSDDLTWPVETSLCEGDSLADKAAEAVMAYRAGDTDRLAGLVRLLTPLLWHTVRAQGADRDLAEDVVQSVWLVLVRNMDSIRDPHATLQWLLVTARRAAWRAVRQARTDAVHQLDDDATAWLTGPPDELPGAALERDERDAALWRHVQDLPERCRRLLGLVALVDRPDYAVVSQSLGMPIGSIGPTRGRCLAKLRMSLAADPTWSHL